MESGSKRGHYQIVRPLGQGGMGEVYLARDTRLDREVAIKVLPDELRHDSERLSRFRREAQAAARLKHPNIATIHALEEFDDELLITMEHVEGQTLKSLIPRNGMELSAFLDTFIPVADALAHAHAQGRIHRDLKPDNIMVGPEGTPKILDFGLALIINPDGQPVPRDAYDTSSDLPTRIDERSSPVRVSEGVPSLTRGGQIIGTPQYMSPEQSEGEAADARTDLFSLGVVMYEALTGRRPFEGKSLESIIGRIITAEPTPVTTLKPGVPYSLELVIRRCLRKKRDERLQSAQELLADLQDIRHELAAGLVLVDASSESAAAANARAGKRRAWQLAAGAAVLMGLAALGARYSAPAPERTVRRFALHTSRLPTGLGALVSGPSISPDGKRVTYIDEDSLWIRELDRVEPRKVEDTGGAYSPFWSPDGKAIGYGKNASGVVARRGNALWTISVDGGTNVKLCDVPGVVEKAVWLGTGEIVFSVSTATGKTVQAVPDRGGTPRVLMSVEGVRTRVHPFYAHDAQSYLVAFVERDGTRLELHDGESSHNVDIGPDALGRLPRYASTGHLLYNRGNGGADGQPESLWATPFSISTMSETGPPFLVAQNASHASVSLDGTLVYQVDDADALDAQQLVWVDRSGAVQATIGEPQYRIRNPVLSPDERRVAVRGDDIGGADASDIWLHEVDRPIRMRLISREGFDEEPSWSADGTQIVWAGQAIFTTSVDAPDNPRKLVDHGSYPSFSPDGKYLVYHAGSGPASSGSRDIWYLALEEDAEPIPYLQTEFEEGVPVLSPDGRFLAYVSDETGSFEVYIQRFPERGDKQQVSLDGGVYPRWNGAGDELFFVTGNTLMAARVDNRGGLLRIREPTPLFDGDTLDATLNTRVNLRTTYDVTKDGERFVVVQDIRSDNPTPIVVVENWYEAFREQE